MIRHHRFPESSICPFPLILLFLILTGCVTSETEVKSSAPKGIESPQWKEGDTWVHQGPKGEVTTEVERIDDSEIVLRSGKLRYRYDHNLALLNETLDDQLTVEYDPPYKGWRFFPLWVGKEWENHWTEKKEGSKSSFNERGKVVGWENIMTYAGVSRALRIDLTRTNLKTQKRHERSVWYSPETKYPVRVTWKELSDRDRILVEFKQKPGGSRPVKPVVAKAQPQPGSDKVPKEGKQIQKAEERAAPDEGLRKRLDEIYDLMVKESFLTPEELSEVYDAPVSDVSLPAKLKILMDATDYDYLPFHPMFYLALEKEDYDDAELIRRNWVSWLYRISDLLDPYRRDDPRINKIIERSKLQIEKLEIVGFTDPLLIRLRKELTSALDQKKWDDAQKIQSLIVSRTGELRSTQPKEPRPALTPPPVPASSAQPARTENAEQAQQSSGDDMGKVLERIGGRLLKGTTSQSSDSQAEGEGSSGYLSEDMIRALEVMKGKGSKKELSSKEKGTLQLIDVLLGVIKKK